MANETEMTRDERRTYLKGMHLRYHQAHRVGRIAWGEARSWMSSDEMEQVTGLHRQSLVAAAWPTPGPRLAPAWPTPDTASPPAPAVTDVWRATAPRHRTAPPSGCACRAKDLSAPTTRLATCRTCRWTRISWETRDPGHWAGTSSFELTRPGPLALRKRASRRRERGRRARYPQHGLWTVAMRARACYTG